MATIAPPLFFSAAGAVCTGFAAATAAGAFAARAAARAFSASWTAFAERVMVSPLCCFGMGSVAPLGSTFRSELGTTRVGRSSSPGSAGIRREGTESSSSGVDAGRGCLFARPSKSGLPSISSIEPPASLSASAKSSAACFMTVGSGRPWPACGGAGGGEDSVIIGGGAEEPTPMPIMVALREPKVAR